jgi:TRAP-type C4-dicarboxylate transport system permease small subunit
MNPVKMAALAMIVVGILALLYGGFSYTKDTHDAKIGPLELSVKEKERVNIPVWAGVVAVVAGGALLLVRQKR